MAEEATTSRTSRSRTPWLIVLLVLVVAVAAVVVWRLDLVDRVLGDHDAAPSHDPVSVPPPPGLDLPAVPTPSPVAPSLTDQQVAATGGDRLDEKAILAAITPSLGSKSLGRHQRALVAPLAGGQATVDLGSGSATPASTTKLVTTTSALLALGPQHTFTTTVVGRGHHVTLVGGGDPYLARSPDDELLDGAPVGADLTTLATRTALKLKAHHVTRVTLGYDDSLYSGPDVSPFWPDTYIPEGVVAPISPLWVDEGRPASGLGRIAAPALGAAQDFAADLESAGVTVVGPPTAQTGRGPTLASMASAPLDRIVERILMVSDNEGAETLLRQVGLAQAHDGSFDAGRRAVLSLLGHAGVTFGSGDDHTVLHDGSGLSRQDTMDPQTLVDVLRLDASADHPELRAVLTGLPVAGFDGSLAERLDDGPPAALGRVRAKTGTLTGVTSLAGIALGPDDVPMVFVLMADRLPKNADLLARVAQDDAAAALGACACTVGAARHRVHGGRGDGGGG